MKQISSYVMQDDQLFPMLTVLETLRFAAEVRLPPSLSRAEKLNRVWELIEQLGLQVIPPTSFVPCSSIIRFFFFFFLQKKKKRLSCTVSFGWLSNLTKKPLNLSADQKKRPIVLVVFFIILLF
jgi:hypothetical protein